ncbi:MAG: hypothetical protein JSS49_09325 [Planctomycetes bacterium]|nr:hypothetical protein [Planctomycetota bacterium]
MPEAATIPATPMVPRWIPILLNAAAIYNVAWGVFVILFPNLPFQLVGMAPVNYPALVQCLGMIVGVYGVGYAMAARDPVALWPLVLVGLLGKVFGPIGFVYAAWIEEFPWIAGVTILTNDVIWWVPFAAILLYAARINDSRQATAAGLNLDDVLKETPLSTGQSLHSASMEQDLLLVCVRHSGCTFCREALDDLARQRGAILQSGVRPVVIHMGTTEQGSELLRRCNCADMDQVSDPTRRVYRALDLRLGTLTELFGARAFWRAIAGGTIFRFGFGKLVGNVWQMPGAFLIRHGRILTAFRHQSSSDRPNYTQIACSARSGQTTSRS